MSSLNASIIDAAADSRETLAGLCEECGWKDNRKLANDYRKASVD